MAAAEGDVAITVPSGVGSPIVLPPPPLGETHQPNGDGSIADDATSDGVSPHIRPSLHPRTQEDVPDNPRTQEDVPDNLNSSIVSSQDGATVDHLSQGSRVFDVSGIMLAACLSALFVVMFKDHKKYPRLDQAAAVLLFISALILILGMLCERKKVEICGLVLIAVAIVLLAVQFFLIQFH